MLRRELLAGADNFNLDFNLMLPAASGAKCGVKFFLERQCCSGINHFDEVHQKFSSSAESMTMAFYTMLSRDEVACSNGMGRKFSKSLISNSVQGDYFRKLQDLQFKIDLGQGFESF